MPMKFTKGTTWFKPKSKKDKAIARKRRRSKAAADKIKAKTAPTAPEVWFISLVNREPTIGRYEHRKPILEGKYVVDFQFPDVKVVVDIVTDKHNKPKPMDQELQSAGYEIIRILAYSLGYGKDTIQKLKDRYWELRKKEVMDKENLSNT